MTVATVLRDRSAQPEHEHEQQQQLCRLQGVACLQAQVTNPDASRDAKQMYTLLI